jgi:hypothetical protein
MTTATEPQQDPTGEEEKTPEVTTSAPEDSVAQQIAELKSYFQKELEAFKQPKETPKPPKEAPKTKDASADARLRELEEELEKARTQSQIHLQTAILVQNGLRSTRFAKQLLAEYDGTKSFEQFVEECKADKDFSLLFTPATTPPSPKPPAPGAPDGGSPGPRLGNTKAAEAQLREFAQSMWPTDKFRQDAYIKHRMAMEKKG